jgi:dipeptidyl aminopeptidase/acylaminoacyl peptidase
MAVKHRRYPVYGVQFHPESIGTTEGKRLLENFMRIAHAAIVALVAVCGPLSAPAHAQVPGAAATIQPGDNLVVQGVPRIPAALASDVRRYTESRGASVANWHPTRRELLIATRFGNTNQLHLVKAPGGARHQITFFDEPVNGGTFERTTGRYIVFSRDVGGNEFGQLYRLDLQDGRATLLTDGGRSQNGGTRWHPAGDRLAYASTRRNGADRDIYVMDPANPASDRRVLQVQGGGWGVADWSPDGRQLLVGEYLSVNKSNLWLVDVADGRKTLVTPADTASYGSATFARDGKGIYFTTDRGSEFHRLAYLDLATRRITTLVDNLDWDVDDAELSPDGRTIAFVVNEAGISRLHFLDTQTRRSRAVAANVPIGVISGLSWHPQGAEIAFSVASAQTPSDVYSLNPASGELTRWTESELGGIAAADLSEPTLIKWTSFDGLEISGFYYRPPARFTGRRPVMISIHGGPESQFRPGFLGRTNYYLNELGIALIAPNVRGSSGYGKTFVNLDNGMKREDSVRDIGALLEWIARQPELDAGKIMVTGGSYGGYMTLAVATNYNDRIACALDVVGISSFTTFLTNTESYRRDLRRAEYGDERVPAMRSYFERINPLTNAGKISKPLFVVQGGNDPRVPRTESEQMVERVRQNGSAVWYLEARDEGHGFRKKTNQDFQFYASVMFVRQFLLGESPGAPAPTP